MNNKPEYRLNLLLKAGSQHLLKGGLKGLEKESLRITAAGRIAQTPHPRALGSALKHHSITTDYSEALIELITPPFQEAVDALKYLGDLHKFVYQHLDDELLLATSMPCEIDGDESIPIAQYGKSNVGRMKHIYRRGLAWRYGRAMQAIAGIHFNYSVNQAFWPVFQELLGSTDPLERFISDQYFHLIRNIKRNNWLILFLFGASPAFSKSFFSGREHLATRFEAFDSSTLYRPYATSLRMSDIGYRNDSQSGLNISFENLDEYVSTLTRAITTPYREYEKIGVKVDGDYRQLSANILQISNEYYSPIRPKQLVNSCEHPTQALKRRGIRYIELRSLDLGCFDPLGVTVSQLHFLELFLLACLLQESPSLSADETMEIDRNGLSVACCGRLPGFTLMRGGNMVPLRDRAFELAEIMGAIAEIMDAGEVDRPYAASLSGLYQAISDLEATPSARVLETMRVHGESHGAFALRLSQQHATVFRTNRLEAPRAEQFRREAEQSWREQELHEAADRIGFDEFLQQYFAQA